MVMVARCIDSDQSPTGVRKQVDEITKFCQKALLEITQDGGKNAQKNLNNVIEALIFGAALTIFVVYVFHPGGTDVDYCLEFANVGYCRFYRRVVVGLH